MKNFLTAFIVFMVWSLFGLWIYSWLLPENATAKNEIVINTPPIISKKIIQKKLDDTLVKTPSETKQETLKDSSSIINKPILQGLKATNETADIIFIFQEGISIFKNNQVVEIPNNIVDYKYKINTYLLEHPNKEVHIYSIYSPKENVASPNIGILRASEIKKQLIKTGVSKEKIVLKSSIKDIDFLEDNSFANGIYFIFKPLDNKRIEAIKNSIPTTKIVYPKFTNSGITVNNDLKILLSELIVYFSEHPNNTITIIGHTDNIGNGKDNYNVGLKYAQQVRWYLVSKGDIKKSRIKAISKGESEPLESNNSRKGRIANKRIEVIFN